MPDTVSKERRSEIMSRIKSKDASIELKVRKKLHSLGYRFRVNYKALPGKPDIVFTKKRIILFIHGCFWHGHEIGCRYSHTPQSRKKYWASKILKIKERDKNNQISLLKDGWIVITLWECGIEKNFDETLEMIINILNN